MFISATKTSQRQEVSKLFSPASVQTHTQGTFTLIQGFTMTALGEKRKAQTKMCVKKKKIPVDTNTLCPLKMM